MSGHAILTRIFLVGWGVHTLVTSFLCTSSDLNEQILLCHHHALCLSTKEHHQPSTVGLCQSVTF